MSFKRPLELTAQELIELHKEPGLGLLNPAFELNESSTDPEDNADGTTKRHAQPVDTNGAVKTETAVESHSSRSVGGNVNCTDETRQHADDKHVLMSTDPEEAPPSPGLQMRAIPPPNLVSPSVQRSVAAQISPLAVHSLSASNSFSTSDLVDDSAESVTSTNKTTEQDSQHIKLKLPSASEFGGLAKRRRHISQSSNTSASSLPAPAALLPQHTSSQSASPRPLRRSETVAALAAQHGVPPTPPNARRRPARHSDNLFHAAATLMMEQHNQSSEIRRVDSSTSLRTNPSQGSSTPSLLRRQLAHSLSTPETAHAVRRPARHTENLQTLTAHVAAGQPPSPQPTRPGRHSENLWRSAAKLATQQRLRAISGSSSEEVGRAADREGSVVLAIDEIERNTLRSLRDGQIIRLPPSGSSQSLTPQKTEPEEDLSQTPQPSMDRASAEGLTGRSSPPPSVTFQPSIQREDTISIASQSVDNSGNLNGVNGFDTASTDTDESESQHPPGSKDDFKHNRFKKNLAIVGSAMYATFLVIIGVIVFVADIVNPTYEVAEIYTCILSVVGLCWLVSLHIHVQRYLSRLARVAQHSQEGLGVLGRQLILEPTEVDGEYRVRMPFKPSGPAAMIQCQYSFSVGRHSGSFYLKIGAAFFCFGHLVHLILLLVRHINNIVEHGDECLDIPNVILYSIQPVFSFLQLYIIFKYSNIIICHRKASARFGFMHCIASSLNMWIWSIVKETIDAVQEHNAEHGTIHYNISNCTECTMEIALEETTLAYQKCVYDDDLSEAVSSLSAYLFPLTIEFNILIVGVWFVIWQNIGNAHLGRFLTGDMAHLEGTTNEAVLHIDCGRANRGLLTGLLVLVAVVVDIILFFALADQHALTASYISQCGEAGLSALMTVLCLLVYHRLSQLDVNCHPVSFLDDLLLFVCLPAFFAYGVIVLIPALLTHHESGAGYVLDVAVPLLLMTQVVIQTPLLMDGLRRCSNTDQLRASKPGREYITVLLFSNLAMWLLQTLESQASQQQLGEEFYGSFMWTMLRHATMPLCLFYRFHSSVCLADIWKSAYEPGN